jgi:transposase-like protein
LVSNGHDVKNGKQKYHCKSCGKYGTLDAASRYSLRYNLAKSVYI